MRTDHLAEALRVPADRVVDVLRGAASHVPTDRIEERLPRRRRRRSGTPLAFALLVVATAIAALLVVRRRGHDALVEPPRTDPADMAGADPDADPGVLGLDDDAVAGTEPRAS